MASRDGFAEKQSIRDGVWDTLHTHGIAPNCHDTIPNFIGKGQAAEHLAVSALWGSFIDSGQGIMTAPDSVLEPVRRRALEDGIPTYMAVPGLRSDIAPFVYFGQRRIDNDRPLNEVYHFGEGIEMDDMAERLPSFISVIGGSVAVDNSGNRTGKGMGYFDTEVAALKAIGKLTPHTQILSVVHSLQVVTTTLPSESHDARLTGYATEKEFMVIDSKYHQEPPDLQPDALSDHARSIPLVKWLLRNHFN